MTLEDLLDEIPDGPLWIRGEWLQDLLQALIEDRALLAEGTGDVDPTPNGRVFSVSIASAGSRENGYVGVAGIIRLASMDVRDAS